MANTKNIEDRSDRKKAKRRLRRALKETFANLSQQQKKKFRAAETKSLRKWLAEA